MSSKQQRSCYPLDTGGRCRLIRDDELDRISSCYRGSDDASYGEGGNEEYCEKQRCKAEGGKDRGDTSPWTRPVAFYES